MFVTEMHPPTHNHNHNSAMNNHPNQNAYQADFYFLGDMPFTVPPPQAYYSKQPAPPPPHMQHPHPHPPPQMMMMPPHQLQQQQQQQQQQRPKRELVEPHDNDVLMGRGGKNNQHVGNENLRDMARAVREEYQKSAKKGKSNMSRDLVQKVRSLDPPGRFLKRNAVSNEWEDVGDEVAREKVSQVLRDAVSEYCGPKSEKTSGASDSGGSSDEMEDKDDEKESGEPKVEPATSEEQANSKAPLGEPQIKEDTTPMKRPENASTTATTASETEPLIAPEEPEQSAPIRIVTEELKSSNKGAVQEVDIDNDDTFDPLPIDVGDTNTGLSEDANADMNVALEPSTIETTDENSPNKQPRTKRKSWNVNVPVASVPWRRNRAQNRGGNKTNFLEKYSSMNMGTSEGSMSIGSFTVNSTSSRQLMSNRQLSNRTLSSRQLVNARQLSGRQLTLERRKQNFAERYALTGMGESDLSLDSLSISGHSRSSSSRTRSRKNIFMDQYSSMDMGLSDSNFSLGSTRSRCDSNFSMSNGTGAAPSAHGGNHRPSVIVEGDLESDLENSTTTRFADVMYESAGIGQSESNFTMNTIGTFSGHSRMSRGGLLSLASGPSMRSMRMESGHSFLTIDELELDMLDDDFFDDCEMDDAADYDADEFSSEFC